MTAIDEWGPDLQSAPVQPHHDEVTRALPHAVGPEKSVLSSMLQEPDKYVPAAIEAGLKETHFYLPAHSTLFGFMLEIFEKGIEIELVSLVQHLLDRGLLDRVGGVSTVTDLYTYSPNPAHFSGHVAFLKDKRLLRGIIEISQEAIEKAYDSPDQSAELLDEVETSLTALRETDRKSSGISSVREGMKSVIQELQDLITGKEGVRGISSGYEDLDRKGATLKPGDMGVIAARPSMGKTSLLLNMVESVCVDQKVPGLIFSCEMTRHQLINRIVYSRAKFAFNRLVRGEKPDKGDLQRIQRAMREVAESPIRIDETAGISIGELRAKARREHRESKGQLGFIGIDYMQLMKSGSRQAQGSREREIAEISSGVKNLAKELSLPIVILAQLNRDSEKRTGKHRGIPRMSDLRESGAIEQDADWIGLLHRAAYFAENEDERAKMAGRATLSLAKNRNGETGDIPLTWIAELMRFESGSPAEEPEELFQGPKTRYDV